MRTSFWTYFTSGYGMLWLTLLFCSLITQTHIDAGLFGLIGFPLIALVYAGIRRSQDADRERDERVAGFISPKMAEFLNEHPEFCNAPKKLQEAAFHQWLSGAEPS